MHTLSLILLSSRLYYIPQQFLAWAIWCVIFGAIGLLAGWLLWRKCRERANEIEEANRRLAEEHRELRRELGNPLWKNF